MNNNPKFRDCPARMAYGLHFTDYRPTSCGVDTEVQLQNGITNSYDYRAFLQNNAQTIIDYNRAYAIHKNKCKPCDAPQVIWSASGPLYPTTPARDLTPPDRPGPY